MKTDILIDQLETYSNAIVGFIVAQSLGFSFTFGTNPSFSCEITAYKLLAIGLVIHFVLSTVLATWVVMAIRRKIAALSNENVQTLRLAFRAKAVVVVLFAVIPIALLSTFGIFGDPSKGRCGKVAASAHHVAAVHGRALA